MKHKLRRIGPLAMCLALLLTTACSVRSPSSGVFRFVIQDEDGAGVGQAEIALYSFLDERVVATGRANAFGSVVLQYAPSLPQKDAVCCGDYLVLVTKAGYAPRLHMMTKLYTGGDAFDPEVAAALNSRAQQITLSSAPEGEAVGSPSAEEQRIADYCRESGKLTAASPIYVLQDGDVAALGAAGQLSETRSACGYYDQEVPLGELHTDASCTVRVTCSMDDLVHVEAAQRVGDAFLISGSVSRPLGQAVQLPDFAVSDSRGMRRTYATQGTFVERTVCYLSQGEVCTTETVSLQEVSGGVYWDDPVRCSECTASATAVLAGQYGTYIHLLPGSMQTHYGQRTVALGAKTSIPQLSLELGTALTTAKGSEVAYSASGELYLYDLDHSGELYHITGTA